jgi:hypothetical protein
VALGCNYSVRSTTAALAAFAFTDSMPFSAFTFRLIPLAGGDDLAIRSVEVKAELAGFVF